MKKTLILLLAILFMPSVNVFPLDVILTKSRMQIQCQIISQDESTITYRLANSQDTVLYTMEKLDIERIYPHIDDTNIQIEKNIVSTQKELDTRHDIILLKDGTSIDVILIEVGDNQVKYRKASNPNGPLFVKEKSGILTITYANGDTEVCSSSDMGKKDMLTEEKETVMTNQRQQISFAPNNDMQIRDLVLARAERFSGVYAFTDCEPMSSYDVIGEISTNGGSDFFYSSGGGLGTVIASSGTLQYTDIRNQLISNAVLANRQVEGVIIRIPREGEGTALMIKFKNANEDHAVARVNSYLGVYIFMDNKPIRQYSSVGEIKGIGGLDSDYNVLRNKLIRRCLKRFPNTKGVIPHFVSGGRDSGEAITF